MHAYGFDKQALELTNSYLLERKQRTKLGVHYSSWKEILSGVPQGSILGPLLFNIFLCDLFVHLKDIDFASYADDNTPYTEHESIGQVISRLEETAKSLFKWFSDNQMKANPGKCHLLLNNSCKKKINIGKFEIESSMQEKLLGITIDNDVNLASHVKNLCENASRKMHALARISPYMSLTKKRSLLSAFFVSQFNYCPLAWMCHSRTLNNRINKLHERCLCVIYNDKKSTFQ